MKNVYAVVDAEGKTKFIEKSLTAARRSAKTLRPNGIYLDKRAIDMKEHALRNDSYTNALPRAVKALASIASVSWREVEAFGMDSAGRQAAFEKVLPFFPGSKFQKVGGTEKDPVFGVRPVKAQQKAIPLVDSLLGKNYKTNKTGEKALGGVSVDVLGLSLIPHSLWYDAIGSQSLLNGKKLKRVNFCNNASAECKASCLVYSGQNQADLYNAVIKLAKSDALMAEPAAFIRLLTEAALNHVNTPGCTINLLRLNVFSDIPWEIICPEMLEYVSDKFLSANKLKLNRQGLLIGQNKKPKRHQLQLTGAPFYDYTKIPGRAFSDHYDLTFSYSGVNLKFTIKELEAGRRVAMVFIDLSTGSRKPKKLPDSVVLDGKKYPVVDGDIHDARPFDPRGVIVGLKYKAPRAESSKIREARSTGKFEAGFSEAYGDFYEGIKRVSGTSQYGDFDESTSRFLVPVEQTLIKNSSRRKPAFIVPAQETDDGYLVAPVIPRQQPGVLKNEKEDYLTPRQVDETFGAQDIIDTIAEDDVT